MKYSYCPRCGELESHDDQKYCRYCLRDVSILDRKERKKAQLVKTDIDVREDTWNIKEPHGLNGTTESLYRYIWETYVDIPENENLNREVFEKQKAETLAFFRSGGISAKIKAEERAASEPVKCPICRSTQITTTTKGLSAGKAVAGAVVAGAAGAVVGAAHGSGKVVNLCAKCGHKWEPGK